MSSISCTIEELSLPETAGGPDAAAFVEMIDIRNRVEVDILGTDALSVTPHGILPYFRNTPTRSRRHFVARVDGHMVARAIMGWSTAAGTTEARINIDVLPGHRGTGIGAALLAVLEDAATALGRSALQSQQAHKPIVGGLRITSPTGFGDVSADDPGVRFLVSHGYVLELVARISSLDLATVAGPAEAQMLTAQEQAGADYRVVTWSGLTPDDRLEDLAALKTGMATDAPMAGMEVAPDPWDAERVHEQGLRQRATGRTLVTAAAEHVPSGRLVAYTEIEVDPGPSPFAVQEDTLVLRSHRGHRLGLLLKAANIIHLLEVAPGARAITTFNAEDNRLMLDVNEALGFEPIGLEGNWQKRV
jgi:GNAT superfamily N-acetyltransferase